MPVTVYTEDFAELATPACTLAIGSTRTLMLFGGDIARPADNHTAILEFRVSDVDAEFARLSDLIKNTTVQQPTTMPWGNRSLLFRDPDGNLVNSSSPSPPRRSGSLTDRDGRDWLGFGNCQSLPAFVIPGRSSRESGVAETLGSMPRCWPWSAAEQIPHRGRARRSRHGSSGLRRVAKLLAPPVDDEKTALPRRAGARPTSRSTCARPARRNHARSRAR
nr:VOC family protein [Mesorhizobium sp. B2-3-14]